MDAQSILRLTVDLFHTSLSMCHEHESGSKWWGWKGMADKECVGEYDEHTGLTEAPEFVAVTIIKD